MQAEIITIGDEILIGQVVDTNSAWMAQQLNAIGIHVPAEYENPANIPEDLLPHELFTTPGEGRRF